MWPKKHIWEYKSLPWHPFNISMRFLLRPVMLMFSYGKISHWWHWNKLPLQKKWEGHTVAGGKDIFRRKGMVSHIKMSLGGWKNVYIITPQKKGNWQIGFTADYQNIEKCSLILEGPIRFLQGPDDYKIFGFDLLGNEIPLSVTGPYKRNDTSIPWPII